MIEAPLEFRHICPDPGNDECLGCLKEEKLSRRHAVMPDSCT